MCYSPNALNIRYFISAEREEVPSTVPLINIIHQSYPEFNWIATTVSIFIITSITVSYIVVGTGMKHVLDGFANGLRATVTTSSNTDTTFERLKSRLYQLDVKWKKIGLYVLAFGLIITIALINPKVRTIINDKSLEK